MHPLLVDCIDPITEHIAEPQRLFDIIRRTVSGGEDAIALWDRDVAPHLLGTDLYARTIHDGGVLRGGLWPAFDGTVRVYFSRESDPGGYTCAACVWKKTQLRWFWSDTNSARDLQAQVTGELV